MGSRLRSHLTQALELAEAAYKTDKRAIDLIVACRVAIAALDLYEEKVV